MKGKAIVLLVLLSSCVGHSYLDNYKEARKTFSKKDYLKSLTLLNDCLSDYPDFIDGHILRAKVYLHLHDTAKAISDYTFVVTQLDTVNTYSFYELSRIHCATENYPEALSDIRKAIQTKGGDLVWIERTNYVFAAPRYNVNMNKLRFQRMLVYYQSADFNKAFRELNFFNGSVYRIKDVNYLRGNCLIELGYPDEAYEAYKTASDWGSVKADSVLKLFHY